MVVSYWIFEELDIYSAKIYQKPELVDVQEFQHLRVCSVANFNPVFDAL